MISLPANVFAHTSRAALALLLSIACAGGCSSASPASADKGVPVLSPSPPSAAAATAPPAVPDPSEAVYPIPPEVIAVERTAKNDSALTPPPPPPAPPSGKARPKSTGDARDRATARRALAPSRGARGAASPLVVAHRQSAPARDATPPPGAAVAAAVPDTPPPPAPPPPAPAVVLKNRVPLVDDQPRARILE
jgi:hypothetical protein